MTRNGYHFAFISLFTVVGAVVRDLNLLVILAGLLIGALAIQWRFCRGMLTGLNVARRLPQEVFAGKSFQVRYSLQNTRTHLPAWLVSLQDQLSNETLRSDSRCGYASVAVLYAQDQTTAGFRCRIDQRGRYRLGPLKIETGFPFGLMHAYQYLKTRESLVVYPRTGTLRRNWQGWLMSQQAGVSVSRRRAGVNEGDFYGLRGWQNGDSRRWIHWRTTARANELCVMQFEQQQRQQVAVLVDLHQDEVDDANFERLVSFAATLVTEVSQNPANQIAVAVNDESVYSNREFRDHRFRAHVLDALATAAPLADSNFSHLLRRLLLSSDVSWPILIASSRPFCIESIVGEDVSETLLKRLDIHWLDLSDPSTDSMFREAIDA